MKTIACLALSLLAATHAPAQNTFHGNDFEDMYIDFYRFISIGAIMSSPVVDRGVVYFGSMDGSLYAIE